MTVKQIDTLDRLVQTAVRAGRRARASESGPGATPRTPNNGRRSSRAPACRVVVDAIRASRCRPLDGQAARPILAGLSHGAHHGRKRVPTSTSCLTSTGAPELSVAPGRLVAAARRRSGRAVRGVDLLDGHTDLERFARSRSCCSRDEVLLKYFSMSLLANAPRSDLVAGAPLPDPQASGRLRPARRAAQLQEPAA